MKFILFWNFIPKEMLWNMLLEFRPTRLSKPTEQSTHPIAWIRNVKKNTIANGWRVYSFYIILRDYFKTYCLNNTDKVTSDVVPRCEDCSSVVKPDAIFFGESLPARFRLVDEDFPRWIFKLGFQEFIFKFKYHLLDATCSSFWALRWQFSPSLL